MARYLKLFIILQAVLLMGCEQANLLCGKEVQKIAVLEQKLATKTQPQPQPQPSPVSNNATLMKQLEQVTLDLVKVKVQRDLLKQELAAYRKRKLKN